MKNQLSKKFIRVIILLIAFTYILDANPSKEKTWVYENSNDTIYERAELISSLDILKSKKMNFVIKCNNLLTNYESRISGIVKLHPEIVSIKDSNEVTHSAFRFDWEKIKWYPFRINIDLHNAKYIDWWGDGYVDGNDVNLIYYSKFDYLQFKEIITDVKKIKKNSFFSDKSMVFKYSDKEFDVSLEFERLQPIIESKSIKFKALKLCKKVNFSEFISGEAFRVNNPVKMINEKGDSIEAICFVYKPINECSLSIYFDKETQKTCIFNSFGCVGGNKIYKKGRDFDDGIIYIESFDSGENLLKLKE